jgi:hypothetical protein
VSPPTNGFPSFSLSDVMGAAKALQPNDRGPFLEMLAERLGQLPEIGAGSLHRAIADIQAEFLFSRSIFAPPPKLPNRAARREWARRPRHSR